MGLFLLPLFIQMGPFISCWCFTACMDTLSVVYDIIYTDNSVILDSVLKYVLRPHTRFPTDHTHGQDT